MAESIRVFAPATVANVAAGFDILGFAVNEPGDEVTLRKTDSRVTTISRITGDGGRLPTASEKNTAGISVVRFLDHLGIDQGIDIELHKKMPLGSGMGSSAASAVASVYAANKLLDEPLTPLELLPFALEGEAMACGTGHADNAAPSLLGGFILIRSYNPLDVVPIATPEALYCTLMHPQIEVLTDDARKILRKNILLKDAITQWGNVAGLIAGLINSDYDLISRSMQDVIIEPVRSLLIPGYDSIKDAAMEAGAMGCSISGSGPSLFALSTSMETARAAGAAMQKACNAIEIESELYISPINKSGPRVLN
jgi:homoserine kinase